MARYDYDAQKVNSALDTLATATKKLSSTASEFSSALSEIVTASKGYLDVDTGTLPAIPGEVESSINELSTMISEKQAEIEAYNASPWYEKLFGSIGMGITKLGEGIATAGEQLVDAGATITGWVGGIFSSDFQDSCAEFIEKDHVGDFFADQYENGALKWVNDKSVFSHTSTAANVFKGVGVATGYVGVAFLTGGAGAAMGGTSIAAGGTAAMGSLGVNATIAGLGGLGSGTQSGLQQGMSFGDASLEGAKQGVWQAVTVFAGGKFAQKLSNKISTSKVPKIADKGDDLLGLPEKASGIIDDTPRLTGSKTGQLELPGEVEVPSGVMVDSTSGKVFASSKKIAFKSTDNVDEVIKNTMGISDEAGKVADGVADIIDTKTGEVLTQTKVDISGPTSKVTNAQFVKDGKTYTTSTGHTIKDSAQILKERLQSSVSSKVDKIKNTAGNISTNVKTTAGEFGTGFKNATTAVGKGFGSAGKTIAHSPAAQGNLAASSINQFRAQNANSQFRIQNDPSNHVPVNADLPDAIAFKNETFKPKEEAKDTTPTDTTQQEESNGNSSATAQPQDNSENAFPTGTQSQARVDSTPSNNTSSVEQPNVEPPKVDNAAKPVPPNNPSTPNTTPPTENGAGNGMSDGMTEIEEPVPGTPETPVTPPNNNNDSTNGAADNIGNIISGGNNSNNGGNYTGSVMGGFNNNHNNLGEPTGPDTGLSYEDKPGIDILDDEPTLIGKDNDAGLDVISIDKGKTGTPSTSNSGVSAIIPTVLGVGAAAAAGVAGVHYIKNKKGAEDNEYYEDENDNQSSFLGEYKPVANDNYDYQSNDEEELVTETPKYKAGTVNQLTLDDGANVIINEDNNIIAPQKEELE